MTIEQLKKYKGCERYSDEEAKEIVENLRMFAKTIIEVWHDNCIDNQQTKHKLKSKNEDSLVVSEINEAA